MEPYPRRAVSYACTAQTPNFLGCCTSNPCNNKGCPVADLRAAGLGFGLAGQEISLSLGSYYPNVYCSSGSWWICASHNPSFQGCCDINPCSANATYCPQSQLHPAAFKAVTPASNSTGSFNTTLPTVTFPVATLLLSTLSMTTIPEAFSIDWSPSSAYKGPSRATRWNYTAYSTRTSSNYTTSRNETMLASLSYFPTSDTPLSTGTALMNVSSTHLSNADNNDTVMTAGPNIVTVTSVLTFTAVRISVYTVPYSLSDSINPSDSTSLSTAGTISTSNSLDSASRTSSPQAASSTSLSPVTSTTPPPDTTTDTKLVAWGATGGVAFILIFAFISWWLRRRRKRTTNNSEKPTTISLLSWLSWKQKRKEIPRISLSTYPFKGMAPSTSRNCENVINETWSASLRDYRNLKVMDMAEYGMGNTQSRNRVPPHLSGYESDYSRPAQSQALRNNEDSTSLGVGLDRSSFDQRMVQRGWDGIDLRNCYVARCDGQGEHDVER
ncbi:hypothetical protein OCU04_001773 [Sclerotinia nivalis]|uniref:Uncharacterized protein n=1 Tax=Sclerotinia nivalis TaxID=352851 RepID=A0A9X0AZV0_9HELO|nr:hypothetical protein OCU04_001773 [Sclerotinia nivalis]